MNFFAPFNREFAYISLLPVWNSVLHESYGNDGLSMHKAHLLTASISLPNNIMWLIAYHLKEVNHSL